MKTDTLYTILFSALLLGCNGSSNKVENQVTSADPSYMRMADSEMKRNPDPRLLDFREKPKWEYSNGLVCSAMLMAWEQTGERRFYDYARYYADSMINKDGSIKTYKRTVFNIDRINPGKMVMKLYKDTGFEHYRKALDTLREQMKEHPRTSEGGFWHKKVYPYQMWLDGLYMGSPYLAEYAKEFNEPELFDDVAKQFILVDKYTYNADKQLFYHGWDESREQKWSNPETGQSPHFWGRAMGWYAMALVDVLDFLPQDHEKRDAIIEILSRLAVGIKKYQDPASGVWWQIVDMGGHEGNYLEASCSSMYTYALLKGVEKGYLDKSYLEVAKKGYEGLLNEFIKENEDGTISLTNICGVAGLGGKPYRDASYEYYIGEPKRDNDPKGVGPFIMAAIYYENVFNSKETN